MCPELASLSLQVISQAISQRLLTPPNNDPQQATAQNILKFLPLMIGERGTHTSMCATVAQLQLVRYCKLNM